MRRLLARAGSDAVAEACLRGGGGGALYQAPRFVPPPPPRARTPSSSSLSLPEEAAAFPSSRLHALLRQPGLERAACFAPLPLYWGRRWHGAAASPAEPAPPVVGEAAGGAPPSPDADAAWAELARMFEAEDEARRREGGDEDDAEVEGEKDGGDDRSHPRQQPVSATRRPVPDNWARHEPAPIAAADAYWK